MEPAEAPALRIAARHLVTGDTWSPVTHKNHRWPIYERDHDLSQAQWHNAAQAM